MTNKKANINRNKCANVFMVDCLSKEEKKNKKYQLNWIYFILINNPYSK